MLYEGVAVDNDSTYEFDGENSVLYFELVEMGNSEPNPDQQDTLTVEFDADDDDSIAYDDNDHVLKYTVGAENYDLYLLSGLEKISLTKESREIPEGGWHDFYDDKKTTVKDLDAASPQTGDSTLTITLTLMALSLLGFLFIKKKKEEEN